MRNKLLMLSLVALANSASAAPELKSANDWMTENFNVGKIIGFTAKVKMVLKTSTGSDRIRNLDVWSKLQQNKVDSQVLIKFNSPKDIQNTGFLQIENSQGDDSIWIYLPALGKSRKLVANNKRDSFFGSDFSYGDILLPAVSNYNHSILREEPCEEDTCVVIESTPANDKVQQDSGYSKKISWLHTNNATEYKVEYFDLTGQRLKTQTAEKYQEIDHEQNRWVPLFRQMVNHQTGHSTTYEFVNIELDKKLPDSMFSARRLER